MLKFEKKKIRRQKVKPLYTVVSPSCLEEKRILHEDAIAQQVIFKRLLVITASASPSKSLQSLVSDPNEDFSVQYQFSFTPFVFRMNRILTPLLDYFTSHVKKKKKIGLRNTTADPIGRAFSEWVCSRSLAGIADWNPAGDTDVCFL